MFVCNGQTIESNMPMTDKMTKEMAIVYFFATVCEGERVELSNNFPDTGGVKHALYG
jgi:hypothetical protein